MQQERKTEPTRVLLAQRADGSEAHIQERQTFLRHRYTDGSWSNWAPEMRTFWIGTTKLGVIDPCLLALPSGEQLTMPPPGIG